MLIVGNHLLLTDAEMGKDGGQDVLGRDALPGDFA